MSSDMMLGAVENIVTLRPAVLLTVAITLAAYVVMTICIRKLRIQGQGNRLAGLFVGLSGKSMFHLGFGWMKFVFTVSCLLLADPIEIPHYFLLAAMILCTLLCRLNLRDMITEAATGGALIAGLIVCSTLLRYLRQIRFETTIFIAYWLLAIFMILCAAAIFLREVTAVSQERKYFDESGETD